MFDLLWGIRFFEGKQIPVGGRDGGNLFVRRDIGCEVWVSGEVWVEEVFDCVVDVVMREGT
ncbi:hypothetical protein, partial [Kocuria salsicia]|uniref:hypothetical protein n=1 Tax=Kocuria salsicia TaxID=664639 RepID=UPI001C92F82F